MFRLDGLSAFAWSGAGIALCCVVYGGLWLAQRLVQRGHGEALEVDDLDALMDVIRDDEEPDEQATEEPDRELADILLWESEMDQLPTIHKYMRRMDRRPAREES